MHNMPIVRLELENMKYSVIHALSTHQEQISKLVEQQLNNVIDNFDYKSVVQKVASDALTEAIKNYFHYGEGYQTIVQAVKEALPKTLNTKKE